MTNTRPRIPLDGHYTMTETADLLGVDRKTIYRWRQDGYLKETQRRRRPGKYILGREILKFFDTCL